MRKSVDNPGAREHVRAGGAAQASPATPHSLDHRALPRVRDLLLPGVRRQLERGEGRGENGEHRVCVGVRWPSAEGAPRGSSALNTAL